MFLVSFFIFIIGAAVGSFLNVLIDRLPRGESIRGRSYCENCNTPLLPWELIPIFSFLFLRGKCRKCGGNIPVRIPVVEFLTGMGFVVLFWFTTDSFRFMADFRGWDFWLQYTAHGVLLSSFIVLFFADLEYGVLPDSVILPVSAATLVWRLLDLRRLLTNSRGLPPFSTFSNAFLFHILPALGLAAFFMLIILVTKGRGMGFGDVKLGFLIGLVLGWPGTLVAAFLGFLFGAVVSVILLISGRKKFGQTIPFGPFLVAGTAVAALYGEVVWSAYVQLL